MPLLVGFAVVILSVLGGYVGAHGKLAALWQPYELVIIGGTAFGAFLIGTPLNVVKATFSGLPQLFKGPRYQRQNYLNVLSLIYELLTKARRDGMMALEGDVEDPAQSALFQRYPDVLSDHHVLVFVTDYLRLMIGSNLEAHELEPLLELELEKHHDEAMAPAQALQRVADALPGFGIVAAVLGIVTTMAAIGGDIAEIGAHVAGALVGTFLGVLLAYGFVGPLATALEAQADHDSRLYEAIKTALLAHLRGYNPKVSLEFARKTLPSLVRPDFADFETHLKTIKQPSRS